MALKQGETVKITLAFTDELDVPVDMFLITYEFYKRLKKEIVTGTSLNKRDTATPNPSTGVYEFLIDLPRLDANEQRETLEITAFGNDIETDPIITVNSIKVEYSR